ncbi:lipopolysaccharide biosynthesis protein [Pseudomonas caricapapayae]|uniref:Lipopolysaccharide biosynthesis protein n=1 Tax=Pseudomonas caricapapayae TaxID=46678 RepID=A0ACC7LV23_9PSED
MLPLLNISLRASTLLGKFLLIFFLARFLAPGDLGLYGLLTATVGYALYAVGLDFYTYTTRELLKHKRAVWGGYLKAHAVLCLVLYAILAPVALLLFYAGWMPWVLLPWFFGLLVLEHVNQEVGRILIAIGRPMIASISLFFRSGLWAVLITVLMFVNPQWRTLEHVFQAWALGATVGLSIGIWCLCRLDIGQWRNAIDWAWVRRGVTVALPFVFATLALRGLFTLDRYWFQALVDLETLGAYVLFGGISGALLSFLDAGVFAFIYPALIKSYQVQDQRAFVTGMRKLLVQTVVLSFGFVLCALIAINPLLSWLDKPLYLAQLHLFPWILAGAVLYSLGMIPHYALYAQSQDKPIIRSHFISLAIFILATAVLSPWLGGLAVPVGLCIAVLFILCWKSWAFYRLTPAPFRSFRPADSQAVI